MRKGRPKVGVDRDPPQRWRGGRASSWRVRPGAKRTITDAQVQTARLHDVVCRAEREDERSHHPISLAVRVPKTLTESFPDILTTCR